MESGAPPAEPRVELELSRLRREVDEAMRETTAALAQVTDLVAMATAPQPSWARRSTGSRCCACVPTKVVVIAIASTGDVARRVFEFERAVDPGLVEWASSYLNESLTGLGVGARMIAGRLADPELDRIEADFVATLGARLHRARAATPAPTSTWTAPRACSPKRTSPTCRGPTN